MACDLDVRVLRRLELLYSICSRFFDRKTWFFRLRNEVKVFFVYFSVCKEIKLFFNYISLITGYC